jgi:hypothetical protein
MNLLEGESVEEFDALSQSLQSEFKPATETERSLVEMMIQHEWLMRRALRMQQDLNAAASDASKVDSKRLHLVVRYYRAHERGYSQAKRNLESLRKNRRVSEKHADKKFAEASADQPQWEQILKKMPTLSNWVN